MGGAGLAFRATTRVIAGRRQSIVLDLASRKWVKLPARALESLRAFLAGGCDAEGELVDGIPRTQIERTVRCLVEQGFLAPDAGGEPPCREAAQGAAAALHFHVTHRCNLACSTCYVAHHLRRAPERLTAREVVRILEVAARAGFSALNVTGGEPTLRADLATVLAAARPLYARVNLTTNGTVLDAELCRRLVDLVDSVAVSLDGATAEVNDRIRGHGSFARTLAGLERLRAAGFPMGRVALGPTVTRANHARLEDVLDLAAGFGAGAFFGFFMPTGRGLCNRERLTLGCGEMLGLFERAAERRKRHLGVAALDDTVEGMRGVRTDCRIGSVITVQADGSIFPCPNLNQPEHCLGNALQLTDAELLQRLRAPEAKARFAARTVERVPGCASCECRYFCGGGCMANAYVASGDLYGPDPYCAFYRAVWRRHGPLRENYAGDAHDGRARDSVKEGSHVR